MAPARMDCTDLHPRWGSPIRPSAVCDLSGNLVLAQWVSIRGDRSRGTERETEIIRWCGGGTAVPGESTARYLQAGNNSSREGAARCAGSLGGSTRPSVLLEVILSCC